MLEITGIDPVPSQTFTVNLANQACQIDLQQLSTGLYMTLAVNNTVIIQGVICENLNRIVRDLYLGFIGDFVFFDNQGTSDPYYTGLGSQFSLVYLEASDLAAGIG